MKALTLSQPWAQLVAVGAKRIETRSWTTRHRGPLAIHAGRRLPAPSSWHPFAKQAFREVLEPIVGRAEHELLAPDIGRLPRGVIVAFAELFDVVPTDRMHRAVGAEVRDGWDRWPGQGVIYSDQEAAFGDFGFGRYGWLLANVTPVDPPIPAAGSLGLWEWDGQVALT